MGHKLLQVSACNHSIKKICTISCPHALNTRRIVPLTTATNDIAAISRCDSTVSAIAPSIRRAEHLRPLSSLQNYYPDPSSSPAAPAVIELNFCPYCFRRYLLTSNYPCVECYMQPRWVHLAVRWMRLYRGGSCHGEGGGCGDVEWGRGIGFDGAG
jgi:hypothetical protein